MAGPKERKIPPLVTLSGVDVVAMGTWKLSSGETTFTRQDLADAIDAASCPSIGPPVMKLGHVDPRFDGEPAVGKVINMELSAGGTKITGDLAGMPGWLGEIAASAYPRRSIEGYRDVQCQQGHTHPFVIAALALLGVTPPGVGVLNDLQDIASLYGVTASEPASTGTKWRTEMTDQVFAAGVTVDDVRRAYMEQAGYQYWITEMQLDPPQLIVADESTRKIYRVPVKIKAGAVTFADPVEVQVEYLDIAASARNALVFYASAEESLAGLGEEVIAAWDAAQQEKNLGPHPGAAKLKAMYAIPGDNKSSSKLPHHDVSSSGAVGAADLDGCVAAIAALNGSRGGLKGVSAAEKRTAYNHLARHLRAGGRTPAPFKASASADGDTEAATTDRKVDPNGTPSPGKQQEEGTDVFTDEQLAELRAALGKGEDEDLTGEEILAALKAREEGKDGGKPAPDKVPALASRRLPPGVIAIDQGELEALQASAKKGEEALHRMQVNERDTVITAAIADGKFAAARREHWARLWDADPQGTREVIASLQKNVVPLRDIGSPGGEMDDELDAEFAGMFRPRS